MFSSQYLRICGSMLFLLNFLFIFRNGVQGMGHPFIPMCSGVLEMVLRIYIIMIFMPRMGFKATAFAEVAAWTGALLLNLAAYLFFMWKLSEKHGILLQCSVCWLTGRDLINSEFTSAMDVLFAEDSVFIVNVFTHFRYFFLGVILFALALDLGTILVKCHKYSSE